MRVITNIFIMADSRTNEKYSEIRAELGLYTA